jgi:hypothetical protein
MKKYSIMLFVTLLLFFIVGSAGAEINRGPQKAPLLSTTGTSFTYQGYLEDLGAPANGTYDFEFKLYDLLSGGSPIATVVKDDVSVSGGYFTATLDFGSVFDGTAYWLEIGVRPGASTGAYTTLIPRQPLTAVPYAVTALNFPTHDHFGESWSGTGTGLSLASADTTGFVNGLWAESASDGGNGIYGYATSTTGPAWGVVGESDADEGIGVYGRANSSSGITAGVEGVADSSADYAVGVVGWSTALTGNTRGVFGITDSDLGEGVFGTATSTSGFTSGVYGRSSSDQGVGVVGWAASTTGVTIGVQGQADSPDGIGLWGYASSNSTSGVPVGVLGQNSSPTGWAVYASGDLGASGSMYISGTKSAIVETSDYGWRELYAVESPEVWFEDFGTGQLVNGQVTIPFEPIFAQTVSLSREYHVFLTPLGDCQLYISAKDIVSFTVNAMGGQTCSIDFDYRVVAKRLGYEDERLASENPPVPSQFSTDLAADTEGGRRLLSGEDYELPSDK